MSIFGIGIDIVEIERVRSSLDKFGDTFAKKILHEGEYKKYEKSRFKERYLAKRFAAKEAFAKALGTGIVSGVTLQKIEIQNNTDGKPELCLHDTTKSRCKKLGIKKCFLSISDEDHYAIAHVVLEK